MDVLLPKLSEKAILEIENVICRQPNPSKELRCLIGIINTVVNDLLDTSKYPITEDVIKDYAQRANLRPTPDGEGYYLKGRGFNKVLHINKGIDNAIYTLSTYYIVPKHIVVGELLGWWLEPQLK